MTKEELMLTPGEVLVLARAEVARLEELVAELEVQKSEAETSDFGNPLLADRLRGQVLPGINSDLRIARERLRRLRDYFVPQVEKELAEDPARKMSPCDSQCFGETQHCIYCHF